MTFLKSILEERIITDLTFIGTWQVTKNVTGGSSEMKSLKTRGSTQRAALRNCLKLFLAN